MTTPMNKPEITPDEMAALRKQVLDHKDLNRQSWADLNRKTGIAASTLQAFANGTYLGNNQNVAQEVERWFKTEETMSFFPDNADILPSFRPTATALKIRANLIWARRGKIVTIVGDPGVGKSIALDAFVKEFPNTWKITLSPSRSNAIAVLRAVLGVFNVPEDKRNVFQLSELVRRLLGDRNDATLIFDEAQHAGEQALEELRAIHDFSRVGMAFVGNRQVTRVIEGNRTANFAQRFSRISMRQIISAPDKADVAELLKAWNVTNDREIEFLTGIAMRPGGGALRSMSMCLELATLLARDADNNAVRTLVHIKDAWSQLSSGNGAI